MDNPSFSYKGLLIGLTLAFLPTSVTSRYLMRCQGTEKLAIELQNGDLFTENCVCEDGYRSMNGFCEPICEPDCGENAECIDIGLCKCLEGYKLLEGKCVPASSCDCPVKSKCNAKGVCECQDGYKMLVGKCEAICDPKCHSSMFCYKPNECRCKIGFKALNLTGFDFCEPVCETGCGSKQFCQGPNTCACLPKHVLLKNGDCEPVCSAGCAEGEHCVGVNRCDCKSGYSRNKSDGKCDLNAELLTKKINSQSASVASSASLTAVSALVGLTCAFLQNCFKIIRHFL